MAANHKLLIIDDEVDLADMVAYQFKAKGFEVQTAADGEEGLEKVNAFKPDLIILDINMPRMGGIEFYNRIAGPDGVPLYPVMILTARANVEGLFKDLPIDGFMTKPFDVDELIAQALLVIHSKQQQFSSQTWGENAPKKVCIAQHDQVVFEKTAFAFTNALYTVIPARTGAMAIERVITMLPDIAVIDLALPDIAGDVVIFRLKQVCKTMNIKFFLTSQKGMLRDQKVMERISAKSGFLSLVEYNDPQDMVDKVKKLL